MRWILLLALWPMLAAAQITNVNIGSAPNAGDGDPLRTAMIKLNTNDVWLSENKQPTNANLTAWAALATSAKQDALGYTPATNSFAGITNALGYQPATNGVSAGGVPAGVICMWSGALANVPSGWALCDGNNGTPDLREKFIKGWTNGVAPGGTGGSTSYTPAGTVSQPTFTGSSSTVVVNHTHTISVNDPGHAHTQSRNSATTGTGTAWTLDASASYSWFNSGYPTTTNTTGITATSADPSGGSASYTPAGTVSQPTFTGTAADVSPAYYVLAFIMKL
jgi:hypothetical protein